MDVEIRPRTEADDPEIVAIRNQARPWLPATTVDEYRWQADPANSPPGAVIERWVATAGDAVVGVYALGEATFMARENTFMGSIGVAGPQRRKGLGSRLFDHFMECALEHGATRIYSQVTEGDDSSAVFAEKRGFKRNGRAMRVSTLALDQANLDGYDGLIERQEAAGITFKSMADIGFDDEPVLRAIHEASFESAKDVPSSEQFQGVPYEVWLNWIQGPNSLPDSSWVAFDGDKPIGVASLSRRGESSGFNDYTGVLREYRGRGIARALKLKTIESARAHNFASILTGNDFTNKAMLSINVPLGYKAVPAELEVVRDIES
jgi:GNAT superfamily N-acetyltransferase